jgi:hypothetical protein
MTISLDPKGGKEFAGEMGEILEEIFAANRTTRVKAN